MELAPITIDPLVIGADSWSELGTLLKSLWWAVVFVVLFASSMIFGHITIPSFIMSGHIPERLSKTRPPLYALAVIFFAVAIFFLIRALSNVSVLRNFWPDYWI